MLFSIELQHQPCALYGSLAILNRSCRRRRHTGSATSSVCRIQRCIIQDSKNNISLNDAVNLQTGLLMMTRLLKC
jgi:hypothetical protein